MCRQHGLTLEFHRGRSFLVTSSESPIICLTHIKFGASFSRDIDDTTTTGFIFISTTMTPLFA